MNIFYIYLDKIKKIIIDQNKKGILKIPENLDSINVEIPPKQFDSDISTNVSMVLAKINKTQPIDLANKLTELIKKEDLNIHNIEVAKPGFINIKFKQNFWNEFLKDIINSKIIYGSSNDPKKYKYLIEFVSANPTGPLHVGHGRHAAYGATLGNILNAAGYEVKREYYVNDAGRQMDILCVSVIIRILESNNPDLIMPAAGYLGDYIKIIAESIDEKIDNTLSEIILQLQNGDNAQDKEQYIDAIIQSAKEILGIEKFSVIKQTSLESIRFDIEEDLNEFGVTFDSWFSENNLAEQGHIKKILSLLKRK